MPLVTAYTEATLLDLLVVELSDVGSTLEWTADSPELQRAVNRTARILGAEVADVTDMDALEAVAVWQVWEVATSALAALMTTITGGQVLTQSQLFAQADKRRVAAKQAALPHLPSHAITSVRRDFSSNPYAYREVETE
jgi:hypothetical protein